MPCMRCRVVLWSGPSRERHAPGSHAVGPGRQPLQADVRGEHRHRILHLLRPLRAGLQPDCLPPGDQEEALLELRLWRLHCAALLYCRQCQVNCPTSHLPYLSTAPPLSCLQSQPRHVIQLHACRWYILAERQAKHD